MEIIDDLLLETQLRRRDITEGVLSLPQIQYVTHEELRTHCRVLGAEYPEFVQPNEELNRFMAQSSQRKPHFHESKEESAVPRGSHEYVQWLEQQSCFVREIMVNYPASPKRNGDETQIVARVLVKLADELEYLRPENESDLGYDINMRRWWTYWNALIAELKTVNDRVPAETSCCGVYVLTTWPYPEFLKTLALTLCPSDATDTASGRLGRKELKSFSEHHL